ncbi:MAG: PKD domain-containing protein [Bacteroidia bacterium]|nr:PKD domain-containing protein [Bacteroidia bacterium]
MRKSLLLTGIFCCLFSFLTQLSAQQIEALDTRLEVEPWRPPHIDRSGPVTCVTDTSRYPTAKASANRLISINNTTSAQALSQYYEAPQPLTIYGFDFFAYSSAANPVSVVCQLYLAGPDSMPAGVALATATAICDTSPLVLSQAYLRRKALFPSPVIINQPYVLVVKNASANTVVIMTNDWAPTSGPANGKGEWLMSGQFPNGTWTRSYNMNVSGTPFNADLEAHPYVKYDIIPDFTADKTCLTSNDNVNFYSKTSSVVANRFYNSAVFGGFGNSSYQWTYGDGSPTGIGDTVNHTYAGAGPYNVKHVIYMGNWATISNCTADTTLTIGGAGLPLAGYTYFLNGLSAAFTDVSSGGTSWNWNFGDGNSSNLQNPTHNYASNGNYPVTLIVSNACGADTFSNSVFINCTIPAPVAAFGWNQAGFLVSFIDSSSNGATWTWNFGDGSATSSQQNPNHTYSNTGMYYVTLIVSNLCGSDTISDSVFAGLVGVNENWQGHQIRFWPNPARDELHLKVETNGWLNAQLLDLQGRLVMEQIIPGHTHVVLDVARLEKGIYFLKIEDQAFKIILRE